MHIDTSRSRFDAAKHYSGVLALQGRVTLDADRNEQQDIWLHLLRSAISDIVGQAGVPRDAAGFAVDRTEATHEKLANLTVLAGRIYVDGIMVENAADTTYWKQPNGYFDPKIDQLPVDGSYLVYLRVWEREVTADQDSDLREVALGIHGPDTTARSQVIWQAAAHPFGADGPGDDAVKTWRDAMEAKARRGLIRARARTPDHVETDVCSISPESMFRGRENQHYRVEVFRSGPAKPPGPAPAPGRHDSALVEAGESALFVWSRNNGSDVYSITAITGAKVTVSQLGRDRQAELDIGDLVEVVDDAAVGLLARDREPDVMRALFKVTDVDRFQQVLTLDRDPTDEFGHDPSLHPILRRWDGAETAIEEGSHWLDLEDGVQVQFPGSEKSPAHYRNGDYWLIAARRATGDVIWPQDDHGPVALKPHGIDYHYAPLALVPADAAAAVTDLRTTFAPLIG